MNAINNLFSNPWADALGWTLLHSIWQALIIVLIVLASLRFIPAIRSTVRYAITCAGFFMMLITSLFTFTYLINQTSSHVSFSDGAKGEVELVMYNEVSVSAVKQTFITFTGIIESNMPLIITAWIMGSLIFAMRLFSGLVYTYKLRASALPLHNTWSEYIQILCNNLGITRFVNLAESAEISTPMVIGYFKPVILVPAGMLTGLTTEQLETIFIHELAHIKRHDFLINLMQAVMETVFFFNPFIWILSNFIRREREYCCDDIVVIRHGNAMVYAQALTKLEEVRLSKNIFALSLAENKNQLLNRIRRIMEKSVKNYSAKDRMLIPAIVLIAGLLCASWLSIDQEDRYKGDSLLTDQDTLKKNDSLPGFGFHLRQQQWEEFSRAFEEKFKERFEDFYSSHETELETIMKELQEKFKSEDWPSARAFEHFNLSEKAFQEAQRAHEEALKRLQEFESSDSFKNLQERMEKLQTEHLPNLDFDMRGINKNFQKYEEALREQLIKDGYLSANETIRSMEWSDESYKVNNKPIKDSDKKKYQELRDKYLGKDRYSGNVE